MSTIRSIVIRPEKKGPVQKVNEARILTAGIEGDHFVRPETRRAVTLISSAGLAAVAASVGFEGDAHSASRRNICIDTLPDGDLVGRRVALGDEVLLEITCYCAPCKRMDENMGEGAVQAFDAKAGWGAIVLREGQVKVGDQCEVI